MLQENSQEYGGNCQQQWLTMIVEAIWDYNEFFHQRFYEAITHKRSCMQTMNCPRSCLDDDYEYILRNDNNNHTNQEDTSCFARQKQALAISELFFYAYSHKYNIPQLKSTTNLSSSSFEIIDPNSDQDECCTELKEEIEREVQRVFTNTETSSTDLFALIEKVVKSNKIVCMFLPVFNRNSIRFNERLIERLKMNFSSVFDFYCTKETGMIYVMNDSNLKFECQENFTQKQELHDCNLFYRQQLQVMKEQYGWSIIEDACDVNNHQTTNFRVYAQISPQIILKTATDSFNEYCHFYSVAAEFATGMYLTEDSVRALSRVYTNQIEKEQRGECQKLSDHVIIMENGKAASIGMIVYSKALKEKTQHNDLFPSNGSHDFAGIYSIATRENFRGKGYATMIVITLLELAKKRGVSKVILHASEQGCGLYSKIGFEKKMQIDVCSIALLSTVK
ncbi:hypothetical protein FDP41_011748 [Naegleria fowleri]|uniref:N-acetyltransferase domain-containing protein n=1 Tax=Naegleria fowleri TaxID=5763 RepID=A0A6A5BX98_NAEFO|nr:uncharacterized protein FDP41_011748 [Naegleria fowleri]KAF0981887.1 hypothetical protein FDP41_011748 [Naegleria fowleri]CAG4713505.1 unnamed protein product [Naegleria fowleri]